MFRSRGIETGAIFALGLEQFWNSGWVEIKGVMGSGAADCVACCLRWQAALRRVPHLEKPILQQTGRGWRTAETKKADCDHERLARAQHDLPDGWCHLSIEFQLKNLRRSKHRGFPSRWRLCRECMDRTTHTLEQGRDIYTMSASPQTPAPRFQGQPATPSFLASPLEHCTERKATSKIDVNDGVVARV